MIAHAALPKAEPESRPRHRVRTARRATEVRLRRTKRLRYQRAVRVLTVLALSTVCVLVYLMLVANITKMHYELVKSERRQADLARTSLLLDGEIEQLAARERLAGIASKLGLRDPHLYAVVQVPRSHTVATRPASGLALLANWLRPNP